jgi:uncharacterized DUF497 family protein
LIPCRRRATIRIISLDERRFVTFGISSSDRLLVVAHAQHEDAIRIITARLATRAERKLYEEG